MKKTVMTMVIVAVMMLTTVGAYAEEVVPEADETRITRRNVIGERQSPEERFEQRIEEMIQKQEARMKEAQERHEGRTNEALEHVEVKLGVVEEYAPELLEAYQEGFDEHIAVHEQLFTEHMDLRSALFDEMLIGLEGLIDTLLPLAESGEITFKELADELRSYLEEQKADSKAIYDSYEAEIAPLKEANELNKVKVEELKQELREAVESGDEVSASAVIESLYEYQQMHLEFDAAKLEILQNITN